VAGRAAAKKASRFSDAQLQTETRRKKQLEEATATLWKVIVDLSLVKEMPQDVQNFEGRLDVQVC